MGEVEDKRLYAHYKEVIAGKFKSSNSVHSELIISDAKRHLANLIAKSKTLFVEEPKVEAKTIKEKK